MLLFNIFSLQFTAMFPLFYKSTGTRSTKFFIGTCRNFRTKCCRTSSSFLNLMSLSYLLCGPNKWKLLAAKSGLHGKCCNSSQPIFYARKQDASRVFAIVWASVRLSVRPSHSWSESKRCKLGSRNLHCGLPQGLSWQNFMPLSAGVPLERGRQRGVPPKKTSFCRYWLE